MRAIAVIAVLVAVTLLIMFSVAMLARRRLIVINVVGTSMQPTYCPGDRVLVRRRAGGQMERGAVVVLPEPPMSGWDMRASLSGARSVSGVDWVLKRVAAVAGDPVPGNVRPAVMGAEIVPEGGLVVLGEHDRSADSRMWGFAPLALVLGSVVRKLPPARRRLRP